MRYAANDTGRVVVFERFNDTTWTRIQNAIERLAGAHTPNTVALDATRDNKIVSNLEDNGVRTDPTQFIATTKRTLIENLITALESGEITLPEGANQLVTELEVFEYDVTDCGRVRYSAP